MIETFNIYIEYCIATKTYHLNDREPPYLWQSLFWLLDRRIGSIWSKIARLQFGRDFAKIIVGYDADISVSEKASHLNHD